MRPKLRFANVIALLALFVSLGGTVYAAATIDGRTIRKNSIPPNRLRENSVGGTQVKEAELKTVPRAQRAAAAERALLADTAQEAARADVATVVQKAAEAARANTATDAGRAALADSAGQATDADALNGVAASKFILSENCASETLKAAAKVDPVAGTPNAPVATHFNCAGGAPTVTAVRDGEYRVSFPNLPAGIPVATAMATGFEASVQPFPGEGAFRVTVYATASNRLEARPFTLAIF